MTVSEDRIAPYRENPFYWSYRGSPVLLLGGSIEDNLFQIRDLERHLDLLASVGGNYVRCTMSSRDEGDAWPFERDPASGLYDLDQPGKVYWVGINSPSYKNFQTQMWVPAKRHVILFATKDKDGKPTPIPPEKLLKATAINSL